MIPDQCRRRDSDGDSSMNEEINEEEAGRPGSSEEDECDTSRKDQRKEHDKGQ